MEQADYVLPNQLPHSLRRFVADSGITRQAAEAIRTKDDVWHAAAQLATWKAVEAKKPAI